MSRALKIDDVVRLKDDIPYQCPKGRRNHRSAKIVSFLSTYGKGAVMVDRDLHGSRFWNVEDLELKTVPRNTEVSRQVKWQRMRKALGLCVQCGKKAIFGTVQCRTCAIKRNVYARNRKGYKPWKKGGVGRPPKHVV